MMFPVAVADMGDGQGHVHPAAVLPDANGLERLDTLALPDQLEDAASLAHAIVRQKDDLRLADDLLG